MIRKLLIAGPDESVIELLLDDQTLKWTCDAMPVLADAANTITQIELRMIGPADGSPITIVYNAVANVFGPEQQIVNDEPSDPELVY